MTNLFSSKKKRYAFAFFLLFRTPSSVSPEKLYRNDGTSFEDNWQERIIERYTFYL